MKTILANPLLAVAKAGALALVAIVITVIVPGLLAAHGNVFYESDMLAKVPPEKQKEIQSFQIHQAELRQQLTAVDQQLLAASRVPINRDTVDSLSAVREHYQKQLDITKPPIALAPFYLNPQMLLWPAIYTCLGWLIFLLPPKRTDDPAWPSKLVWLGIGLGIYVFYQWPLWFRNFVLTNEGRRLYAYPNYDIHHASFFMQEAIILGFCLLLARIWQLWSEDAKNVPRARVAREPLEDALDGDRLDELTATFNHWQVASVILALGFTFFTRFFWDIANRFNDQRYLLTALLAHSLWGLTWILLSLPLARRWHQWNRRRHNAICELALSPAEKYPNRKETLDVLKTLSPISVITSLASGSAAFISFTYPFVRHLITQ